jgi:hypothetical protein
VSHVPYPAGPTLGLKTSKGRFGLAFTLACIAAALIVPEYFFFPMAIAFIGFGLLRAVIYTYLDLLPDQGPIHDEFAGSDVIESRPAGRRIFRNPLRRSHHPAPRREEH